MSKKTLHIQMLGAFKIRASYMTEPVEFSLTGRSRRLWTLVAYLITNKNRGVPPQELIEVLWGDSSGADPLSRLQNNASRARSALGALGFKDAQNLIVCENGLYYWAPTYNLVVDLDILSNAAMKMSSGTADEDDQLYAVDVLRMYEGDFLGNAILEPWAQNIAAYYHSLTSEFCLNVVDSLVELNRYEEIERVCIRAFDLAPDIEEISIQLMRAYVAQGTPQRALDHYARFKKLLRELYDIAPSPAIEAEREDAIRAIHGTEVTEKTVRDFLNASREHTQAFFCSNTTFREIAQLTILATKRFGVEAQFALISIQDVNDRLDDAAKRQALHIEHLRNVISKVLRASDPITKISSSQLLVLLPGATRKAATLAMKRVVKTFQREYPFAHVELAFSLIDIEDLM